MTTAGTIAGKAGLAATPFVGLTHYTEERADVFFGREAERKMIIGNLRASRLTLLYAESGVGKSSLLRAGVASRIRELAGRSKDERGSPRYVPVVFSSWRDDPVAGLIETIDAAVRPLLPEGASLELPRDRLETAIEAAAASVDTTLLVILDQFEEYFLYHSRYEHEGTFAEELAQCVDRPDLRANFLISIREDAYAGLGDLFKARIANVYGNYLHLEFLHRDAAREAILKPIEHFNLEREDEERVAVEPELVETVLDQVRRGRIVIGDVGRGAVNGGVGGSDSEFVETSYLQLVMQRVWEAEMATGSSVLRIATLAALGGADKIIRSHLDEAMTDLPPAQQEVAAAAFRHLVTPSGTKIALSVPDLANLAGVSNDDLTDVVDRLGNVRILRAVAPAAQVGESRYEIFHDVLAAAVLDWRAQYVRAQEREQELREHEEQLQAEQRQREEAEKEAAEAQRREAQERRRARIFRGVMVLCLVLLAAGAATLGYALLQKREADDASFRAASILAADRAEESTKTNASVLASLEAYRLRPTVEALGGVLGALQENAALPRILEGHARRVNSVALSPDSETVASGSADGTVRLWDAAGTSLGAPLRIPESVGTAYNGVAIGADGRTLAAGTSDGKIVLWDISNRRAPKRAAIRTPHASTTAVAFNPDGRTLVSAGDDGRLLPWDVTNPSRPRRLRPLPLRLGVTWALAFAERGEVFAAGDRDGRIQLFDSSTFAPLARLPGGQEGGVWSVAFAPDGNTLASAGGGEDNGRVILWDVSSPQQPRRLKTLAGHADDVYGVGFAERGSVVVSAGADDNVITWDVESGQAFGALRSEEEDILTLAVAADGKTAASAGDDTKVKLWTLTERPSLARLVADTRESTDFAFLGQGVVAEAGRDTGVRLWNVDEQGTRRPTPVARIRPSGSEQTWAVAGHGRVLAVAGGATFSLWDVARPGKPRRIGAPRPQPPASVPPPRPRAGPPGNASDVPTRNHVEDVYDLEFNPAGTLLASAGLDGLVMLWDVSNRGRVRHLARVDAHGSQDVNAVAFDSTGKVLATAGSDGNALLWNVTNPRRPVRLARLRGHEGNEIFEVAFSPTQDVLASGGADENVVLWDVSDPRRARQLGEPLEQSNTILKIAYAPDGRMLAAGDGDGDIVLWDVETRETLGCCLFGRHGTVPAIDALDFDPNGRFLLSGGRGNPIVRWSSTLWSRDLDTLRTYACRLSPRNLTLTEWNEFFADTRLEGELRKTCA